MFHLKNILVVSRSTKHCREAVEAGLALARQNEARLFVLHVMHDVFHLEGWNLPVPNLDEEYKKDVENARKDLDKLIKAEKENGMPITVAVKEGKPDDEIKNFVKEHKIDLVILLAHEEGRLEHFLFGRTNNEILRTMPASILLVKQ